MEGVLQKVYYNVANPGGLGGVDRLISAAKTVDENVTPNLSGVKTWLEKQDVYTLHAPAAKNFQRNRVFVKGIDDQFQADLVDLGEYSKDNDDNRYLLTCIDVFSKYAWVRPIPNKTGACVTKAFKDILCEGRVPQKLQTDAGGEFHNRTFRQLMDDYGIKHFSTGNETKANYIERFHRSYKAHMWRYLTATNSRRYIDVLHDLTDAYNHSYHRSIKMAPMDVTKSNEKKVFTYMYKQKQIPLTAIKYRVGDAVRISKYRGVFRKGYEQTYTDEFFKITECIPRTPPVYRLQDTAGDNIQGTFYAKELQRVIIDKNKVFKIEKILKKKKSKRGIMVLVKWLNWPEKYNSWLLESEVIDTA